MSIIVSEIPSTGPDAIIGWDIAKGAGENARELPVENPSDLVLVEAKDTYNPPEGKNGTGFAYGNFEIWGFDPRLTVIVNLSRVPNPSIGTSFNPTNITATIRAQYVTKSRGLIIPGPDIAVADLFINGGQLDNAGTDDGCELETGVQGIRFAIAATRTNPTSHDIVAQIQVKPNVAFGCAELARKLIRQMTVVAGPVGKF